MRGHQVVPYLAARHRWSPVHKMLGTRRHDDPMWRLVAGCGPYGKEDERALLSDIFLRRLWIWRYRYVPAMWGMGVSEAAQPGQAVPGTGAQRQPSLEGPGESAGRHAPHAARCEPAETGGGSGACDAYRAGPPEFTGDQKSRPCGFES